jgi:hypothetical protein
VGLTNPCIDCVRETCDIVFGNRLAEAKIGLAVVRAQLYKQLRIGRSYEIVCKRQVAGPVTYATRTVASWLETPVEKTVIFCLHGSIAQICAPFRESWLNLSYYEAERLV